MSLDELAPSDLPLVAIYADESCLGNGREGDNPGGAAGVIPPKPAVIGPPGGSPGPNEFDRRVAFADSKPLSNVSVDGEAYSGKPRSGSYFTVNFTRLTFGLYSGHGRNTV